VEDRFHLHGFWPENRVPRSQPQYCKDTRLFGVDVQVISHGLEADMIEWWPSLTRDNRNFWNYEWRKHGSCSRMTRTRYYPDIKKCY
jgi:ribonuclease I